MMYASLSNSNNHIDKYLSQITFLFFWDRNRGFFVGISAEQTKDAGFLLQFMPLFIDFSNVAVDRIFTQVVQLFAHIGDVGTSETYM